MKDLIDKIKEDLPLTQEERLLAMSALSVCEMLHLEVEYGMFCIDNRLIEAAISKDFACYGTFNGSSRIKVVKAKNKEQALSKLNTGGWKFTYAEEL